MNDARAVLRLDKWLWAARFYKTRALAVEAINGGHVHLNGARPKPARTVQCGDELVIRKSGMEFSITVTGVAEQRGPAAAAQQLYQESEDSRMRRAALAEERRLAVAAGALPARRPDKRGRRHIIRFTGRGI